MIKQSGQASRITGLVSVLIVFIVGAHLHAQAGIYSYKDEYGNIHITDRPPHDKKHKILLTTLKRPKGFKEPVDTGRRYDDLISTHARKTGLSYPLLMAIIKSESNFNPQAVSSKGAKGLMQLMPDTWRQFGVTDPFNAEQNIRAGSAYFREMYDRFQDLTLALAAYNAGPSRVEEYGGVPPFEETNRYIRKVYWYYDYYQRQAKLILLPGQATHFDQGIQALGQGRPEEAVKSFMQVVLKFPNSPEANYNLGLAYELNRDLPRAITHYKKTLQVNPYFKEAHYNLAIIYERIGQNQKAISKWEQYLRYEVRQKEIVEVRKYIRELRQLGRQ